MKPIGEVMIVGSWVAEPWDHPTGRLAYVPGIPRATLLRWACEDAGAAWLDDYGQRGGAEASMTMAPEEVAAAALLLCEAIGTDEADSEEWG